MLEDYRHDVLKACEGFSGLSVDSLLCSLRENVDPFYSPPVLKIRQAVRPLPTLPFSLHGYQPFKQEAVVQWSKDSPFQRVSKPPLITNLGKR